jgi:hypothetical protein
MGLIISECLLSVMLVGSEHAWGGRDSRVLGSTEYSAKGGLC